MGWRLGVILAGSEVFGVFLGVLEWGWRWFDFFWKSSCMKEVLGYEESVHCELIGLAEKKRSET